MDDYGEMATLESESESKATTTGRRCRCKCKCRRVGCRIRAVTADNKQQQDRSLFWGDQGAEQVKSTTYCKAIAQCSAHNLSFCPPDGRGRHGQHYAAQSERPACSNTCSDMSCTAAPHLLNHPNHQSARPAMPFGPRAALYLLKHAHGTQTKLAIHLH